MLCRHPELASVCKNSNTLILYPGAGAADLEEADLTSPDPYVIIIIDGTWSQAKDIFFKNSLFRIPKQVIYRTGNFDFTAFFLYLSVYIHCKSNSFIEWKSSIILSYLILLCVLRPPFWSIPRFLYMVQEWWERKRKRPIVVYVPLYPIH